jgi:hypothetical protein
VHEVAERPYNEQHGSSFKKGPLDSSKANLQSRDFDRPSVTLSTVKPIQPVSLQTASWLFLPHHLSHAMAPHSVPPAPQVPVEDPSMDAVSSSSLLRRPGLAEDFVRGSTRNHPFLPGGFDLANAVDGGVLQPLPRGATDGTWLKELAQRGKFQEVAPGLPLGLHFAAAPRVKEAPRHETGGAPPPDLQPVVDSAEVTKVQVG